MRHIPFTASRVCRTDIAVGLWRKFHVLESKIRNISIRRYVAWYFLFNFLKITMWVEVQLAINVFIFSAFFFFFSSSTFRQMHRFPRLSWLSIYWKSICFRLRFILATFAIVNCTRKYIALKTRYLRFIWWWKQYTHEIFPSRYCHFRLKQENLYLRVFGTSEQNFTVCTRVIN